jgi:biotin carboxylase
VKIAIIGASYLQLPLVMKAKELGVETLCFAWEAGAVASEYADKYYPISIIEKERILEICQSEKINAVTTIATDVAVPTVAFIAEKMDIIGNSQYSAYLSTNKFAMRETFAKNNISIPAFFKVTASKKLCDFENLKYPLIVKPCDRSGSMGINKVLNNSELIEAVDIALEASLCKEVIIEEFIEGVEVSVECISWQGKHFILAITDKVTSGAPHYVELAHHQPSLLPENILKKIKDQTIKGLKALEIQYGASHSEFLITPNGNVFITEIGARMGGDFIGSELVELSTGYDFVKGVIEIACGKFVKPELKEKNNSGVFFYSAVTPNVLPLIKSSNKYPNIIKSELTSDKLSPLKRSADRSGYFIYKTDHRMELS